MQEPVVEKIKIIKQGSGYMLFSNPCETYAGSTIPLIRYELTGLGSYAQFNDLVTAFNNWATREIYYLNRDYVQLFLQNNSIVQSHASYTELQKYIPVNASQRSVETSIGLIADLLFNKIVIGLATELPDSPEGKSIEFVWGASISVDELDANHCSVIEYMATLRKIITRYRRYLEHVHASAIHSGSELFSAYKQKNFSHIY